MYTNQGPQFRVAGVTGYSTLPQKIQPIGVLEIYYILVSNSPNSSPTSILYLAYITVTAWLCVFATAWYKIV